MIKTQRHRGTKSSANVSVALCLCAQFFIFLLCGCNRSHTLTRFEGCAMTIPYCIQVGDQLTDEQLKEIQGVILKTFSEINTIYNNWNPDSEVALLGQLPAHQSITLSDSLAAFLAFVDEIVLRTEGRFDPTVDRLQHAWKEHLHAGELPQQATLAPLVQATGWCHVHLEGKLFWKDHALTAIDLGGVAKGYTVDLIAQRLALAGYGSVYVEWGGEIRTVGRHPEGRPWKVGIQGLDAIDLLDSAIATSGTYIQNWTIDGISYTHIIDPRTYEPLQASPISSVSVIASTCAEADALATALMLFPSVADAQNWAYSHGIRAYIW